MNFTNDEMKTYILNIENLYVNGGRYEFDNIVMNVI